MHIQVITLSHQPLQVADLAMIQADRLVSSAFFFNMIVGGKKKREVWIAKMEWHVRLRHL